MPLKAGTLANLANFASDHETELPSPVPDATPTAASFPMWLLTQPLPHPETINNTILTAHTGDTSSPPLSPTPSTPPCSPPQPPPAKRSPTPSPLHGAYQAAVQMGIQPALLRDPIKSRKHKGKGDAPQRADQTPSTSTASPYRPATVAAAEAAHQLLWDTGIHSANHYTAHHKHKPNGTPN